VLLLQVRIKIKVLLFILPPRFHLAILSLDSLLREQPWLRALLVGMVRSLYPYASSPSWLHPPSFHPTRVQLHLLREIVNSQLHFGGGGRLTLCYVFWIQYSSYLRFHGLYNFRTKVCHQRRQGEAWTEARVNPKPYWL